MDIWHNMLSIKLEYNMKLKTNTTSRMPEYFAEFELKIQLILH